MDPIFHIGKASLTPEIITALDEALEKRELIKVAVLKTVLMIRKEIAAIIAERTRSEVVKVIGKRSFYSVRRKKNTKRTAGLIWKMQRQDRTKAFKEGRHFRRFF